jgi:uncharacterized membrane protein YagU involved in acid resistance
VHAIEAYLSCILHVVFCHALTEVFCKLFNHCIVIDIGKGAVVAIIVWLLDLQLPMLSVPITTDVVSSNLDQGEVYNIM